MRTYRRRIILINKPFQLRFCAYVCTWLLALCFIYPLIVSNLFQYFIRYAEAVPGAPDVQVLLQTRHDVLMLLGLTELAFLILTFLICLFMSHRIAGPLYKLKKTFAEFATNPSIPELRFRKMDYFPELAVEFNQMVKALRERPSSGDLARDGTPDAQARLRNEDEMIDVISTRIEAALKIASDDVKNELEPALISLKKIKEQRTLPIET